MKHNSMSIIFLSGILVMTLKYFPSYADQNNTVIFLDTRISLPISVKHAVEQLCRLLTKNKASALMPHAITMLQSETVLDDVLISEGLQEVLSVIDELLAQRNNNRVCLAMIEKIKSTVTDYYNFLTLDEDEAEYRSRPYYTPALFNGPVFITDVNDPQGYAALTVNGLANFTDVNIETVTIDTLNVGQENVANLTVSNSLVLSYLANNAGKFLYLSDNTGTVQAETFLGVEQVEAGNNISITGTTHSPVVNVAGTTANAVQIGSPNGAFHSLSFGTSGYVLISQGPGNSPQWQSPTPITAITTIYGDNGSISPMNSTITFNANTKAGFTVQFSGSGSTMDLLVTSPTTFDTLIGLSAGYNGEIMSQNTIIGYGSFSSNGGGDYNTAIGAEVFGSLLFPVGSTTTTAIGSQIFGTSSATNATGIGMQAFETSTSQNGTAVGYRASNHNSGSNTIALGPLSAFNYNASESNNIVIGNQGVAAESGVIRIGSPQQTSCYIAGISGATSASGVPVLVNSSGQLGTITSSQRYKDNITKLTDHDKLIELEPVEFIYKADSEQRKQYGLIAEDVYEIYPELVVHNAQGEIETVRYDQLHALLIKGIQKQDEEIRDLYVEVNHFKNVAEKQQRLLDDLFARQGLAV